MQHRAHALSPGNGNFAQSGFTSESAMPFALNTSLAFRPSSTRSRRSEPRLSLPEPKMPRFFADLHFGAFFRRVPPKATGTRVRTTVLCCMRETTSWPMKQPFLKSTPFN